jgi:Pentatricopeptide repeat domain
MILLMQPNLRTCTAMIRNRYRDVSAILPIIHPLRCSRSHRATAAQQSAVDAMDAMDAMDGTRTRTCSARGICGSINYKYQVGHMHSGGSRLNALNNTTNDVTLLSHSIWSQSNTSTVEFTSINHMPHQYQQIRWKGRNDGNRFSATEGRVNRKVNKRTRKEYNRKVRKQQFKYSHHGVPGSKARVRKEHIQRDNEELLQGEHVVRDPEMLLQQKRRKTYDYTDALLEDTMGNVNMTTPTPEPLYIGHRHRFYYNQVVDQMDDYHVAVARATATSESETAALLSDGANATTSSSTNSTGTNTTTDMTVPNLSHDLPTDEMISKALRAYRDKNGNRGTNPIGIVKGLQHLFYDMQVPIKALGELTFTTLLTCCRNPQEGRRILQMIREQGLPISSYSYSILCHLHAKTGDYQGCVNVQQEMLQDNISPTLASYTSLLAACYKVCNNGRIPHAERNQAAKVGWEKWQELRIIGIEPDVMAYGAILRLKAASGKAEECLNLLNEMPRFKIYPTTLCYTTALRAVARSHAIAIRYEKGISGRNRRREMITAHHGKIARQIVILAEGANIVKDDGFISALCLCAGEAGDVATVKAIYIANEILRSQQDHLRTIGSNEHLDRLRGVNNDVDDHNGYSIEANQSAMSIMEPYQQQQERMVQNIGGGFESYFDEPIIGQERSVHGSDQNESTIANYSADTSPGEYASSSMNNTVAESQQQPLGHRYTPTFGEREYGKDSRILSSVLHACAQAVHPNMMGSIWQGRENNGYLCINSLRLITQPKLPQYSDNSLPGQTITDNLKLVKDDRDGYREGKRQSRKFAGVDVDEDAGSTLDDILGDADLARRYINPDGRRKFEYRSFTPDEVWRLKYGNDWDKDTASSTKAIAAANTTIGDIDKIPDHLDKEEDAIVNSYLDVLTKQGHIEENEDGEAVAVSQSVGDKPSDATKLENPVGDIYFDYDTMRWKPKSELASPTVSVSKLAETDSQCKEDELNDLRDEQKRASTSDELYFDTDVMRWKARPKVDEIPLNMVKSTAVVADNDTQSDSQSDLDDEDETSDDDEWESDSDDSGEDDEYVFDNQKQQWMLRGQQQESVSLNADVIPEAVTDQNFEAEIFYDEKNQEWKTKYTEDNSSLVEEVPESEIKQSELTTALSEADVFIKEEHIEVNDSVNVVGCIASLPFVYKEKETRRAYCTLPAQHLFNCFLLDRRTAK